MKLILALAVALILTGCATSYQSKGLMGGFSETQLAPDVFRVSFGGNGYTSSERAQDFTLLRAAELTLKNGFRYFIVGDETNTTKVSNYTTAGYAYTSGSFFKGRYSSSTFYSPPTTFSTARPQSGLLIKCYVDKPDSSNAYDATFLQQSLKQKYGLTVNLASQKNTSPYTSPQKEPQPEVKTQTQASLASKAVPKLPEQEVSRPPARPSPQAIEASRSSATPTVYKIEASRFPVSPGSALNEKAMIEELN